MQRFFYFNVLLCWLLVGSGCTISLKGVTIPPEINSYFVEDFRLTSLEAPPDLNQRFSEALRNKVRNESRLALKEVDPDLTFSGTIRSFRITPEAITGNTTAALNKLEIVIDVTLEYKNNEKAGWKNKSYSFFRTFDATQDFQNLQDGLIREIFDLFTEQIFNDSFSQW